MNRPWNKRNGSGAGTGNIVAAYRRTQGQQPLGAVGGWLSCDPEVDHTKEYGNMIQTSRGFAISKTLTSTDVTETLRSEGSKVLEDFCESQKDALSPKMVQWFKDVISQDLNKASVVHPHIVQDPRDVLTLSEGETDLREQLLTQFNEGHKPYSSRTMTTAKHVVQFGPKYSVYLQDSLDNVLDDNQQKKPMTHMVLKKVTNRVLSGSTGLTQIYTYDLPIGLVPMLYMGIHSLLPAAFESYNDVRHEEASDMAENLKSHQKFLEAQGSQDPKIRDVIAAMAKAHKALESMNDDSPCITLDDAASGGSGRKDKVAGGSPEKKKK